MHEGKLLNYLGMSFDFSTDGQVAITMRNTVEGILKGCGVDKCRKTPATESLFDTREDAPKASEEDRKWFHTHVMKLQYLAKRVKPECLTAVNFLSSRVQCCDSDDLAKLRRLLGYVLETKERGGCLRIGDAVDVRVYVDAAYGVHTDGRSQSGMYMTIGEAGPVYAKSGKQRIVTKSSTEAELVGLSDHAGQGISMRNFLVAQGYKMGPLVLYQDNTSCMAIIARGGPTSERSKHISIRYFWLCERIDSGEIAVVHRRTEMMYANVLTKPITGAQFVVEREGLTNWEGQWPKTA